MCLLVNGDEMMIKRHIKSPASNLKHDILSDLSVKYPYRTVPPAHTHNIYTHNLHTLPTHTAYTQPTHTAITHNLHTHRNLVWDTIITTAINTGHGQVKGSTSKVRGKVTGQFCRI